ncbi:MAG: hypothetical protein WCH34_07665 [Bacteroidota bacterium]
MITFTAQIDFFMPNRFSYYSNGMLAVLLKGYLFAKNHFKFFPAFPFSDAVKKENSAKNLISFDRSSQSHVDSSGNVDMLAQKSVDSSGRVDRMVQKSVDSFGRVDMLVRHPVDSTSIFSLFFHQKIAF